MENIRENLQMSGIEHLSFSSMKELRNNEALFLKHYINYEWDTNIYCATVIGKACHHGVESFLTDAEMVKLFNSPSKETCIENIIKIAQEYARNEFIDKYKKPDSFWNTKDMIKYGYTDIIKLVDNYKKQVEILENTPITDTMFEKGEEAEQKFNIENEKLKEIEKSILNKIEEIKANDPGIDDAIQYGKSGSVFTILDGIVLGIRNWFEFVYPKIEKWELVSCESQKTLDIIDLNGEVLDLPMKVITDALFKDENGDLIIVDWKFKGTLSDNSSVKPDYDMQGATYFFGVHSDIDIKPAKAIFFEIQPSEAKFNVTLQADLRKLCDQNEIDWAKGNNGKRMTNPLMQKALLEKNAIEKKAVFYEYVIDFKEKDYLLEIWLVFYKQTIKRLYQLLVEGDDFIANIFDQNFDGGVTVYKDWINQLKPVNTEFTSDDVCL